MNYDNQIVSIALKQVVEVLQKKRQLNMSMRYPYDNSIPSSIKFDVFDGVSLPLTRVGYITDKIVLEGPIRARNVGAKVKEKAFIWYRIELVD